MTVFRRTCVTLGCLLTFCLVGCATMNEQQQADDLHLTLMRFEKTLRWGEFEAANLMRDPDIRTPLPADNQYDRFRVTSYRMIQPPFLNDDGFTQLLMVIGYVRVDDQIEKSMKYQQLWRHAEGTRKWWLMSELPVLQ